jgi:UDP-glucose 4-epimerase
VKIFGKEGTVRDYIYVEDIASGIIAALEYGVIGECYNIGTGTGRTNLEIIKILEPLLKSAGFDAGYELLPPRAFDVKLNILDSGKLTGISGWRPYTELEEGLGKTLDWLIANKG